METSETKAELFKAFANFKKKLKQPLKDANNPFFKSKYVPLENVVQVVDEAMVDTGLSYIQEIEDLEEGYLRVDYLGILKDGLNIKLNGTVTGGEVTFALPNNILSYEGYVRADLYIHWENGSNDGTQPILLSK